VFRRRMCAAAAVGLLAITGIMAGCTSAPLTDVRQIMSKTQDALNNLKSAHFRLEALGNVVFGFEPVETPTPAASESASASASASPSTSPSPSASVGTSESPAASASASVSASPSPTASPTASPTESPTESPSESPTPVPSPTPEATTKIAMDGAYAEGDIDLANQSIHFTGALPGIPGLAGEVLIVQDYAYVRVPGETKYSMEGADQLFVNPANPQDLPISMVKSVIVTADDGRLQPRLIGMEDVLGDTCYHVRVTLTKEVVTNKLGLSGEALGTGTLDLWIVQDTFNLRVLEFHGSDDVAGPMAIRLTLSDFDSIEPITAPPPEQFEIPALQSAGY
jgi:hypothetical protein